MNSSFFQTYCLYLGKTLVGTCCILQMIIKKRDFLCTKNMHKKSRFNVYIGYPIPGLLRRTDENRHMHSMKLLPF